MVPRSTIAGIAAVLLTAWALGRLAAVDAVDRLLTYECFKSCEFDPNAEDLYALTLR